MQISKKDKTTAGILGILLGSIGIHRMYMGYVGLGLLQLVVTFFTFGLGGIWGTIEGILILVQDDWTDSDGRLLRGNERTTRNKSKLRIPGDISNNDKGVMISFYNYITHRNLRFFLVLYLVGNYRRFRPNLSFSYIFVGIVYTIFAFLIFYIIGFASYDLGYDADSGYCDSGCGLGQFISLLIFYTAIFHFFMPIFLPFHWILGNLTIGVENDVATAIEGAKAQSLVFENNLKDLYFLRSEMLDAQKEGIDLGNLLNQIEILENNFITESKSDLSISEIAKLQEEFVTTEGQGN